MRFVCHPVGVDPEVDGEFEFYPHSLEILQAFSLMQKRSFSTRPLGPDAQDLLDLMSSIGQAASIRGYKPHFNQVDGDSEMSLVLRGMRVQTMAVRNPGYPHHIRQVTLELAETVREDFVSVHAIDPVTLVETLLQLKEVSLVRLKEHRSRIARAFKETSYEKVASTYVEAPSARPAGTTASSLSLTYRLLMRIDCSHLWGAISIASKRRCCTTRT